MIMTTHRCNELLKYNKDTYKPCAIRYEKFLPHEPPTWVLSSVHIDSEWMTEYLMTIAKIKFCPYCGGELL